MGMSKLEMLCERIADLESVLQDMCADGGIIGVSLDGYKGDVGVSLHASTEFMHELESTGATLHIVERDSIHYPYKVKTDINGVTVYCICNKEEVETFET